MGTTTSPRALGDLGCATGTLERAVGLGVVRTPAWRALVTSWDRLPLDDTGDGELRFPDRRFADFRCVAADDDPGDPGDGGGGGLKVFEQLAYRFTTADDELCVNPALRDVLGWLVRELDRAGGAGPGHWQARCFRNRTVAHPGRPGLPAPEGAQRGGSDYSAVVLIRRTGVVGGTTVVHRPETGEPLRRVLLTRPGDFALTDDRRLQQRASPLALAGRGTTAGHRDVLVVRFARL